jgi:hypothetical protein
MRVARCGFNSSSFSYSRLNPVVFGELLDFEDEDEDDNEND